MAKGSIKKIEKDNIEKLCCVIKDPILQKRIQVCMEWYQKKAINNKRIFYILSIMTITLPLLVTMVNSLEGMTNACAKNMASIFSMLATLAASFLCLFKCQEKWILYRTTLERMKKKLSLYQAGIIGDNAVKELFIELEDCMDVEHVKWEGLQNQGGAVEPEIKSGNVKEVNDSSDWGNQKDGKIDGRYDDT